MQDDFYPLANPAQRVGAGSRAPETSLGARVPSTAVLQAGSGFRTYGDLQVARRAYAPTVAAGVAAG